MKNSPVFLLYRIFCGWLLMAAIFLIPACRKDPSTKNYPQGSNGQVNTWILDSLKRYYYWNNELPAKPDYNSEPTAFFRAVKSNSDRFSRLYLPNDPATFPVSTRSLYGFDYAIVQDRGNTFGLVKVVLKNSPAANYGLKRGDYVTKVNGQSIVAGNVAAIEKELLANRQVRLVLAKWNGTAYEDQPEINMLAGFTFEQPAQTKILDQGGAKIAYVYIDGFNPGLCSTMTTAFSGFKSAGVTDLILDLRYNAGGEVSEAAGLGGMIASGIGFNTPFITYKGNKNGGTRNESFGEAATFDGQINFNSLLTYNLGLRRIFVLTTGATASASEVIINNLKPYVQVVQIGTRTLGKDEASFLIRDNRNPKLVNWEMYPIVYKLFNAAGSGGYSSGIAPDIQVNELESLPLLPFGDANDLLVKTALLKISGQSNKTGFSANAGTPGQSGFSTPEILSDSHLKQAECSIVITHH